MIFEIVMISLISVLILAVGVLIYFQLDSRNKINREIETQQEAAKQIKEKIVDFAQKEWVENDKPISLDSIDLSALSGVDTNILTNILGDSSYLTNMFASMLDDSDLLDVVQKHTKMPRVVAKPILVNVMAAMTKILQKLLFSKITGETKPKQLGVQVEPIEYFADYKPRTDF